MDENYIIDNAAGLLAMMKNWRPPSKTTLSDTLAANAKALTDMGKMTEGIYKTPNRLKVEAWLDSIGSTAIERDEVLGECAENESARAYYLARANGEII